MLQLHDGTGREGLDLQLMSKVLLPQTAPLSRVESLQFEPCEPKQHCVANQALLHVQDRSGAVGQCRGQEQQQH